MELEKTYEPRRFESHWAQWWVENNVFRADPKAPGAVFSIVVPPPNVTGSMHIGHMLEHSLIDTAARWHRMRGDKTLFLPGVELRFGAANVSRSAPNSLAPLLKRSSACTSAA